MLQCSADECERSQVRTRPDPVTGEPARWCMFHPEAPPPELDAKGRVKNPTPLKASNPVEAAADREIRDRARRHAELPEEFRATAEKVARDLTDGPLVGTGLTASYDLEPVVRDVEVIPLPDGTAAVIGAPLPVTPQDLVGPAETPTPETRRQLAEPERDGGPAEPETRRQLASGFHPPPYDDVPLVGVSMGYPIRISDPEGYRLARDNPIRVPAAFVELGEEHGLHGSTPADGWVAGTLEAHVPVGDPCGACQRPRDEHLAPRAPLRLDGPTVTLTAEEYRTIVRGLGIGPAREDEQPADTAPRAGLPWRVGRQVGRTLYGATDELLGVMDSPGLAASVVEAINAHVPAKLAADRQAHAAPLERLLTALDDAAAVESDTTMTPAVRKAAAKLDECLTALFYAATQPADAPAQPATHRKHRISEEGRARMRENGLRLAARNRELRAARDADQ